MQLPDRLQKPCDETIDSWDVTFCLYDRRVPHHEVIEIDTELTWVVAVDDRDAELIETTAASTVADASIPDWTRDALREAGVTRVAENGGSA